MTAYPDIRGRFLQRAVTRTASALAMAQMIGAAAGSSIAQPTAKSMQHKKVG